MGRRLIGISVSLLLAAVGTLLLIGYVRSAEQRALAGERTVEVLVVSQQIPRGTPAEQVGDRVVTELIPAKVQAQQAVASLDDLAGKVAAVALLPGEQIVAARWVDPEILQAAAQVEVPEGLLQVTVSLDPQRAFGGQLKPGDLVAVLASFEPFQTGAIEPSELDEAQEAQVADEEAPERPRQTPNSTHIVLHKVLVTNVQVEQLPRVPEEQLDGEEQGYTPDLAPTGNLLISLAVSAPDVERIVFTAEFGSIWLAQEPEDASEEGTRIQSRGTIYLEQ